MLQKSCGDVRFKTSMPAKLASEKIASRRYPARRSEGVTAASCTRRTVAMASFWISRMGSASRYHIWTRLSATVTARTVRNRRIFAASIALSSRGNAVCR